jgi:hypothetical protein
MYYRAYEGAARFIKNRFGEKDVEAILERLGRLTQDEAKMTALEILQVVHGLAQNMNMTMDGKQMLFGFPMSVECPLEGRSSINGIREALGTFGCWRRARPISEYR